MPHSWAATASNQAASYFTVKDAVATGALLWSSGDPGAGAFPTPPVGAHAEGYVFTRAAFDAHVAHSDMSASGIAANQLMSKSQMETYRVVASVAVTGTTTDPQDAGVWSAQVTFSVSSGTNSVKVEKSVNGGAYSTVETLNVTPGSSGNVTSDITGTDGQSLQIRLTPYTGANGTGTAGAAVVETPTEP